MFWFRGCCSFVWEWRVKLAKRDKIRQLALEVARSCSDDNCENIVVLDLRGISSITDYFVIATGSSDRQLRTAADHILKSAKEKGIAPMGVDGYDQAHWILIDFVDVIVHLFMPEYREIYDLELLWGDAPKVRWQRRKRKKTS